VRSWASDRVLGHRHRVCYPKETNNCTSIVLETCDSQRIRWARIPRQKIFRFQSNRAGIRSVAIIVEGGSNSVRLYGEARDEFGREVFGVPQCDAAGELRADQ